MILISRVVAPLARMRRLEVRDPALGSRTKLFVSDGDLGVFISCLLFWRGDILRLPSSSTAVRVGAGATLGVVRSVLEGKLV